MLVQSLKILITLFFVDMPGSSLTVYTTCSYLQLPHHISDDLSNCCRQWAQVCIQEASCLKDLYATARKTLPKMGYCSHCELQKKRETLMICARCRFCQYCNVNCQAAAWDGHKNECRMHDISRKRPGTYMLMNTA